MVKIKNGNQFDRYIVSHIIECQTENIKFQNIVFDCKTITDAKGNVFSVQPERGKWAVRVTRGNWNDEEIRMCPNCRKTFRNLEIANYCPSCGLPMETEVEE